MGCRGSKDLEEGTRGGGGPAVEPGWPAKGEAAWERRRPGGAGHPVGGGRRRGRGEGIDAGNGRAARRQEWLVSAAAEGGGGRRSRERRRKAGASALVRRVARPAYAGNRLPLDSYCPTV